MLTPEQIADGLRSAVNDTNEALMAWANGPDNVGPLSQDAHHICVQITAALRLLEVNFRRALCPEPRHD